MDREDSFMLELVSNASHDMYPENTLAEFTNFLPDQVNLDEGNWHVGLLEATLPTTFHNIVDGKFKYYYSHNETITHHTDTEVWTIDLTTYPVLHRGNEVEMINALINVIGEGSYSVDDETKKMSIFLPDDDSAFIFDGIVASQILGFERAHVFAGMGPHESRHKFGSAPFLLRYSETFRYGKILSRTEKTEESPAHDMGMGIKYHSNYHWRKFYEVAQGVYESVDQIFNAMRNAVEPPDMAERWSFTYEVDEHSKFISIKLPNAGCTLTFSGKHLAYVLGFERDRTLRGSGPHIGNFPVDLARIHFVSIFSDIVQYSFVGDVEAPLLRSITLDNRMQNAKLKTTNNVKLFNFNQIHSRKVAKKNFHSIKIHIRAPTGEFAPFVGIGVTRLTLQFTRLPFNVSK